MLLAFDLALGCTLFSLAAARRSSRRNVEARHPGALVPVPSAMMGFGSSSGLASPRLPPIEKVATSSYASPRSFGPARDAAVRRLQTLNLTPRAGGAGGRIGLVPAPGGLAKLPGLSSAPRRATFTQTFNGGPARLPPPLGPPPSEEVLAARRAKALEKKREQAEQAERRAADLRAQKLEACELRVIPTQRHSPRRGDGPPAVGVGCDHLTRGALLPSENRRSAAANEASPGGRADTVASARVSLAAHHSIAGDARSRLKPGVALRVRGGAI